MAVLRRLAIKGLISDVQETARGPLEGLLAGRSLTDAEQIVAVFKASTSPPPATGKPAAGMPVPTAADATRPFSMANWAKEKLYS